MTIAATEAIPAPAPVDVPPPQPALAPAPPAQRARLHLWLLLAITALGFVLRFSYPTRPPLWGDDAYTVYRTHADYQSMLDILQRDGFTPLHYELYWLIGRTGETSNRPITNSGKEIWHSESLTPTRVRFLPALWGSLMAPVMYFLAVHLVRRRTALVVALVSACSAYLLGYSRDGKMYMMLWLFSALSTACLLWWFRTGLRVAWLAWVAASLAMASSHMPGMAMLPFQAIFFLTRSRVHWKESIAFLFGLAITASGPVAYITQFNTWAQEEVEDFGFEVEGLGWVVDYNAGRDGPDLLRYATSAYLFSWEWPKSADERQIQPWVLTTLKAATWLLLFIAAVGAMPWSRRLRGLPPAPARQSGGSAPPGVLPVQPLAQSPQPWWRTLLWLALWLVIPVYFMYCRSVTDFASPRDWLVELGASLGGPTWVRPDGTLSPTLWCCLAGAAAIIAVLIFRFARFRQVLVWLVPGAIAGFLIVSLLRMGLPGPELEGAQWVQYLARPLIRWADFITEPWVLTALAILLPGLALYYCGHTAADRLKRCLQFAAVVLCVLVACNFLYAKVHAKLEKEIDQFVEQHPRYQSADPQRNAALREQVKPQLQGRNAPWQSIFMPRYIGFVWIPFCIGLCALYMRLPTRPLRIAAITLLIGVNLLQFRARLFAGTEPPLDEVARDVWNHDTVHNKDADPTGRAYINDRPVSGPGHPGYGTLQGQQGKYYLGLARGYWIHPTQWKNVSSDEYFDIHPQGRRRGDLNPASIALEVRREPDLRTVIIWEKYFGKVPPPDAPDPFLRALGPQWTRTAQKDYAVRLHWNWTDLYTYRRCEYTRRS